MKNNDKKAEQLGMPIGTASNKLKKEILFSLLEKYNENYCFQCKQKIESSDVLSIEHKIPYLDSDKPKELFFDLNNIAFSHLTCNVGAKRNTKTLAHPSVQAYSRGCRCNECRVLMTEAKREYRKKNKI